LARERRKIIYWVQETPQQTKCCVGAGSAQGVC
jgi:hypothetical protein